MIANGTLLTCENNLITLCPTKMTKSGKVNWFGL